MRNGFRKLRRTVCEASIVLSICILAACPGRAGIILEGDTPDFSFVKKVEYKAGQNAFILNDSVVYLNPVSRNEFNQLQEALKKEDKIGVSIGGDQSTVFGGLSPLGGIVRKLRAADRFLVAIALGNLEYIPGYKFADGYRPKPGDGRIVVFFNFRDFRFAMTPDGELRRSGAKITSTVIPLSMSRGAAGFLPDNDRIAHGDVDSRYVENLKHIDAHIDYYAKEKAVRTILAYGEAAAFIRSMKAKGVKVESLY